MIWLNLWAIVHLFSNKSSQNPVKEFLLVCYLLKESCGKKEHQVNTNRCLLFIFKIDHTLSAYILDILQCPWFWVDSTTK